ncbi:MAG: NADH-quinone oxidoreductase subunit NuoH [Alloprevotella sp.]|nr:NADH-quinone oxidoreductase subunit NuoH [Alloprevotella sp.]
MLNLQTWTSAIHAWLLGLVPEWAAILLECIVVALLIITLYAVFAIVLIYMERKVCAFFQCRIGPNRVGKWGLLQVFSDVFKMLQKEIINMRKSDMLLHDLAPFLVVTASMLTFACLPWNKGGHIIDFNVGLFFMVAVSSIGVVGILLAGLGSNSKYPMIGSMRAGAQLISYEISIGITMLTIVALSGTMQISEIVQQQADNGWNIVRGHVPAVIAFIIYLIAGNAECNRGPFDLPEGESELTAGYHTEYSGMHFGYFYLAEYLNLFIAAGIASTLFLGGWAPLHIAGLDGFNGVMDAIPGAVWFIGKTFFVIFLLMWERWTFPRLRIDHILSLEWKYLMPLSLLNLLLMALVVVFGLGINVNM